MDEILLILAVYVSIQVLGKACKVIPVMLMGKVVSGNTYEFYEWATAGMLSVGISLFLLSQGWYTRVTVLIRCKLSYKRLQPIFTIRIRDQLEISSIGYKVVHLMSLYHSASQPF